MSVVYWIYSMDFLINFANLIIVVFEIGLNLLSRDTVIFKPLEWIQVYSSALHSPSYPIQVPINLLNISMYMSMRILVYHGDHCMWLGLTGYRFQCALVSWKRSVIVIWAHSIIMKSSVVGILSLHQCTLQLRVLVSSVHSCPVRWSVSDLCACLNNCKVA